MKIRIPPELLLIMDKLCQKQFSTSGKKVIEHWIKQTVKHKNLELR